MQPAQPSTIEMFLPFIVIFVIFYFLIIRPQSKRMKDHEGFLKELKPGTQVVTNSGIIGTISDLDEQFVSLQIAPSVTIKMLRKQVSGALNAANKETKK